MMSGELTANLTYESAYASDAETLQKRRLLHREDKFEGCETPRLGGLSDDSRYYSDSETPYKDSLTQMINQFKSRPQKLFEQNQLIQSLSKREVNQQTVAKLSDGQIIKALFYGIFKVLVQISCLPFLIPMSPVLFFAYLLFNILRYQHIKIPSAIEYVMPKFFDQLYLKTVLKWLILISVLPASIGLSSLSTAVAGPVIISLVSAHWTYCLGA